MPNTSKLSRYLKSEHCKDGDIINFMDAGVIEDKTFTKDGKETVNTVLEMTVEINGDRKIFSPNAGTRRFLEEAWGTDTEDWVGKQAKIMIVPDNFGRNKILAKPIV